MHASTLRIWTLLGVATLASHPAPSLAKPFEIGGVEGVANVELSYGVLARVDDHDENLVAVANGGDARSANFDDGTQNYGEGVVSNMVQASADLSLRWRFLGAYVRGLGYYDFETELDDRERTDLSSGAERYVGKHAELRDYYLDARFRIRGMPVQLRVGDQILNWGESTFLRFGVQVVNPVDLVALFRPASSTRDLQIPQGMLSAAALLTDEIAVEGYYQYEWEPVRTAPIGWYFSDNDTLGADEIGAVMAGSGAFSDLGTDLDAAFGLPAGTLGFDRDFMSTPGRGTQEPSDQGQGGVTIQAILPRFNSSKIALHFVNYHSRLPVVGARTASAGAVAATTPEAVAARAAALAPIYEGQGLPPDQAAAAAQAAASALTVGEYASEASFYSEYPEDIRMLGVSFNTATLRTGTLISGEVSHHFDYPFQILANDVFAAAFSAIEFDPSFGQGPLGDYGPDARVSGVAKRDKTQLELGLRQLLGPRLGASQTVLGFDVGFVHVYDLPDSDDLRLAAPGITGPRDFDHLPDADSWGYRVLAGLTYEGVLGSFTVQPRIVWLHDVHGNTPGPGGAFVEERQAVSVGASVDYTNTWLFQLDYTSFFGAGRFNLLNDRDFVRLQLTWYY